MKLTMLLGMLIVVALAMPASGQDGIASHYATYDSDQNGATVACPGRRLVNSALTAAHRSLPCGSRVRVTNKANGRSVVVTIIDRGPFVRGRVIDLTTGAASALGFRGLAHVSLSAL